MEKKIEVKTYQIDYICDTCNEGKMRPTGISFPTNPPQYPHVCDKCGAAQTFRNKIYPAIIHAIIHEPAESE